MPYQPDTHLVLVLLAGQLSAWAVSTVAPAQALPLQGQPQLPVSTAPLLAGALNDVRERLEGEGTDPVALHWLLDDSGRRLATAVCARDGDGLSMPWQMLDWHWLAKRFGLPADASPGSEHLQHEVLPWLACNDGSEERQQQRDALHREHEDEAQRLQSERSRLQLDNERLRAQNQAVQRVDAERLVSFLPALFPRVFTLIGPVDLALLCGRLEPLAIPNPYPEPSEETLRVLQKRFRDLPRGLQQQVVDFVAHLPQRQRLVVRAEMRGLVTELEEG